MNCEEALKKLYDIIDKEAEKTDIEDVHKHLESCQGCMSRYEFEKMFKIFVAEKNSARSDHPDLKKNILGKIDQLEKKRLGLGRRFRFGAVIFSAAAAFLICLTAALMTADFYRHRTYLVPLEKMHENAFNGNHQTQFASANNMAEAENFITGDMHLSVNYDSSAYTVLGGCCCDIQNSRFSHLKVIYQNLNVSILIGKADGWDLPGFEKTVIDGREYYFHSCRHCSMLYHLENGVIIIAITDKSNVDLQPVIRTFRTI